MYHSLHKQNTLIVVFGLIFGIASALSLTYLRSHQNSSAKIVNSTKKIGESIQEYEQPTAEPDDFCIDVPVLFYHHIQPLDKAEEKGQKSLSVAPGNFESHIIYLKEQGYNPIFFEELVNALHVKKKLDNAVVISLDDGYRDNYLYAYTIAKKHDVKINIEMVTGLTGHEEHLTWGQLKEMNASGLVAIQNHSWSHMSLHGEDKNNIQRQVMKSQLLLEENLSIKPRIMIYPYGRTGDVVKQILDENNFAAAFTADEGITHCLSEIYNLPRLRTGNFHLSAHGL